MGIKQSLLFEVEVSPPVPVDGLLARRRYAVDAADWKRTGSVYTPGPVAEAMTRWAVRTASDRVLDPACGDGVFLSAASARLKSLGARAPRVIGVDLDAEAAARSCAVHADFFSWAGTSGSVDVILGNPPYIRSHLFDEGSRRRAFQLMAEDGLKPSRLMSCNRSRVFNRSR